MDWPLLVGDDTVGIAAAATDVALLRLFVQDMRTRAPRPSRAAEFLVDCMLSEPLAAAVKRAIFGRLHFEPARALPPRDDPAPLLALVRARRVTEAVDRACRSAFVFQLAARCGPDDVRRGRPSRLLEGMLNYCVLAFFDLATDAEFAAMATLYLCCLAKRVCGRHDWLVRELLRARLE